MVEMLKNNIIQYDKYLIYGYGTVGKIFESYLRFVSKDYMIYDDKKPKVDRFLDSIDDIINYSPDCIIVATANKNFQEQILNFIKDLKYKKYTPTTNDIDYARMYRLSDIYEKRVNKTIFEKNCFLDMLEKGYLTQKVDFVQKVNVAESYCYNDICVENGDIVVDAGASSPNHKDCATVFFANKTSNSVYAFEPITSLYRDIVTYSDKVANIVPYNVALGHKSGIVKFLSIGAGSKVVYGEDINALEVKMSTLDETINGRIDFIKMDIEGAELDALKGAENCIKTYKPKLSICIYHKPEDIYTIPEYIKSIVPEYKIWIVNNEGNYWVGTKIFAKVYKD